MGDRGIPKTWRHMNGHSSHTYALRPEDDDWGEVNAYSKDGISSFQATNPLGTGGWRDAQ
jgi:catalase